MNKGQKLWEKAKEIIPWGTSLLSKTSEMFLPEKWPSYFEKAKGIKVWDLDGNEFFDFSIMGVGSCILGYNDSDVNRAVKKVIDKGNMCTLNSPEEVELAELLFKMHKWAGMVRYARTGGEAMAIAIRIARAYTGKDKIAFCGYHGWHDWYLSANLSDDKNLDGHLLPGLKPTGVPRVLKGTVFPFQIVSKGKGILSRPISLVIEGKDIKYVFNKGKVKFIKKEETRVFCKGRTFEKGDLKVYYRWSNTRREDF